MRTAWDEEIAAAARRRKQWEMATGGRLDPTQVSAVSAWLRNSATSGSVASVADLFSSNPATASGTEQPTGSTGANGLPILDFDGSTDFLTWPAASNNNSTSVWGVALWVSVDTVSGLHGLISALPGATNKVEFLQNGADLLFDVYHSQFVARRATCSTAFAAGTKYFLTAEFEGAQSTDDTKVTITINGTVTAHTNSDTAGAPGAFPSAMVSTAGPYFIGARGPAGAASRFDGKLGTNTYILGSKMAAATQGLLTTGARSFLASFEPYT